MKSPSSTFIQLFSFINAKQKSMNNWRAVLFLSLSFLIGGLNLSGQGCSDAGFCTVNGLHPQEEMTQEDGPKNQLKVGSFYGSADYSINVYGAYLEFRRQLNAAWGLSVKATSLGQNGNGISTFGLGDLFLNGTYQANGQLSFTLGAKIPFNRSDRSENGSHLPMDYQSSLGTYDLILGAAYQFAGWQISAGWQQPLIQNNNLFRPGFHPFNSDLSAFQNTYGFQRAGDVLLRISYPLTLNPKLSLTPSLLPIYHLQNDRYQNFRGQEFEIEGSQGLTLNVNFYLAYSLSNSSALQLNAGFPLLVREARPDGLTRSFIANLEYRINL